MPSTAGEGALRLGGQGAGGSGCDRLCRPDSLPQNYFCQLCALHYCPCGFALSPLGNAPSAKAMNHWVPKSADQIIDASNEAVASSLTRFSQSLEVDVAN